MRGKSVESVRETSEMAWIRNEKKRGGKVLFWKDG